METAAEEDRRFRLTGSALISDRVRWRGKSAHAQSSAPSAARSVGQGGSGRGEWQRDVGVFAFGVAGRGRERYNVFSYGPRGRPSAPLLEDEWGADDPDIFTSADEGNERDEEHRKGSVDFETVECENKGEQKEKKIDLKNDSVIENSELIKWEDSGSDRRAGCFITVIEETPLCVFPLLIGAKGRGMDNFERRHTGISLRFNKDAGDNQGCGVVELRHESDKGVLLKARKVMQEMIDSALEKMPYTHFLSLPILLDDNTEVPTQFGKWKTAVQAKVTERDGSLGCDSRHLSLADDDVYQLPGQLHYTLFMLRLYRRSDIESVRQIMRDLPKADAGEHPSVRALFDASRPKEAGDFHLPPKGLHLRFKGVKCMDEEVESARVLYTTEDTHTDAHTPTHTPTHAHAHSNQGLMAVPSSASSTTELDSAPWHYWLNIRRRGETYIQALALYLLERLMEAGLLSEAELTRQKLVDSSGQKKGPKLHVTLVNAKYARPQAFEEAGSYQEVLGDMRSAAKEGRPLTKENEKGLDCRPVFDDRRLRDFDFKEAVITGLHLSRRGAANAGTKFYNADHITPIRPQIGL